MKELTNKEKITIKYHRHLDGTEIDNMMYFTMEDVHKCMGEYAESIRKDLVSAIKNK